MAAASRPTDDARRVRRVLGAVAIAGLMVVAAIFAVMREEAPANGPTVDEKIAVLRAERASLQARADSEARIGLLPSFRTAGLLFDALALRSDSDGHRAFDLLPDVRRHVFGELDALNGALKDALDRPTEGARLAPPGWPLAWLVCRAAALPPAQAPMRYSARHSARHSAHWAPVSVRRWRGAAARNVAHRTG